MMTCAAMLSAVLERHSWKVSYLTFAVIIYLGFVR